MRTEVKMNLRAAVGASMLHALEPARRAMAGSNARGPKDCMEGKRTSVR